MLLCILGFSASGKDSIANEIISKLGFTKIVQHTSRPQRKSELFGIDYYFISTLEFEKDIVADEFLSYRLFITTNDKCYYGIKRNSINIHNKKIVVIDIEGLVDLKKNYSDNDILSIFIDVDYELRLERVKIRGDVDFDEFERRATDDESKKSLIYTECSEVVENINFEECFLCIQKIIENYFLKEKR